MYCGLVKPFTLSYGVRFLMHTTSGVYSNVTDLYNGDTGEWSTAQLSVARSGLAATSVGSVAIFAGGGPFYTQGSFCFKEGFGGSLLRAESLRVPICLVTLHRHRLCLISATAGGSIRVGSVAVDLYNATTHSWSTAQLSVGRFVFAATSVRDVAVFAGGYTGDTGKCMSQQQAPSPLVLHLS